MKLIALFLTVGILPLSAAVHAQRVSLSFDNAGLSTVFKEIRKQTAYDFFYTDNLLSKSKPVSIHVKDVNMKDALKQLLSKQSLSYSIENNIIVIHAQKVPLDSIESEPPHIVTGHVADEHGKPLSGITIKVKGNQLAGAVTNERGEFYIRVQDDKAILQFSSVGFVSKELPAGAQPMNVVLLADVGDLDQVQVIAYGTTTKRFNTGDVTTITAKEIEKNPVNNVLEALQGKVPGLFIQQVTGQPNGAFSLRLRDAANFASATPPAPLVVVDGVTYPGAKLPMEANTLVGTGNFLQGGNGLNFLNPNDIESISVLKDADATSLYGASGAYGVVLITTKKAKPGTPTLTLNVYDGVSMLGQSIKPMNTEQYLTLRAEALKNDGLTVGVGDKDLNGTYPKDRYNNFQKETLGKLAQTSNANLSYGGGTLNTNYLVSGSLRQTGNIQLHKGSNIDGSLRFSLNTTTLNNKLTYAIAGTYLSAVNTMVPIDLSRSILFQAPNAPPLFLPDGSVNWEDGSSIVGDINRQYRSVTNNLIANTTLVYRPTKNLSFRANLGYNNLSGEEQSQVPTTTMSPTTTNAAAQTYGLFHHYQVRNITIEPYAEYANVFGRKADFSFKLGGKIDNNQRLSDDITGTGFASDALLSNPSVATTVATAFTNTPYRDLGAYAIAKLIWDKKYIINLNGRRDGSTRFGPGKKFGNFGSVALAWIFSEENWFKNTLPFISFGKIRATTGVVGGDAIGDFVYLSKYTAASGAYSGKTVLNPGGLSNPDLSWEHNKNSEIGLELGFINNRINVEGNYYHNVATNQLITVPLPAVTGFGSFPLNTDAVIRTSGWEASLSTANIKTKNFSWTTRFNISLPASKLTKLPTHNTLGINYVLNKPVTGTKLFDYKGVNPETGYFSYQNGKGAVADYQALQLGDADKTQFMDLAPKYYGGFSNSLSYKQLSLDFTFTYTKRMGQNALAQNGFPVGYMGVNGPTFWMNRWQQPGDHTDIPRVSTSISNLTNFFLLFANSTGAYTDASYARLQNLSIRYSFNRSLLASAHLKDFSVYLQGQNLLTISKFHGLDPENLSMTIIPPMRIITAGLNASF